MTYVRLVNGGIRAEVDLLPSQARRYDTGEWVYNLGSAPVQDVHATGWYEVVAVEHPAETAQAVYVRTVEIVDGGTAEVWTAREKSEAEQAMELQESHAETISQRADAHIARLQIIAASTGTLTAAQLSNAVRSLAAMGLDVGRLVLRKLDTIEEAP